MGVIRHLKKSCTHDTRHTDIATELAQWAHSVKLMIVKKGKGCLWLLPLTPVTAESSCWSDPLQTESTKVTNLCVFDTAFKSCFDTATTVFIQCSWEFFASVFAPCNFAQ